METKNVMIDSVINHQTNTSISPSSKDFNDVKARKGLKTIWVTDKNFK